MFLFILESFGTPELLIIGMVALILLGPRRLPELARKAGKMMTEFRGTANEFKETWQREVDFEEEAKALDIKALETESTMRVDTIPVNETINTPDKPTIRQVNPSKFENFVQADLFNAQESSSEKESQSESESDLNENDKRNWL